MSEQKKAVNMFAWGKGMEAAGVENSRLVDALKRPRFEGWERLENLNLPRYKRIIKPLAEFLEMPHDFLSQQQEESSWFVLLEPRNGGKRLRKMGLKTDEVLEFINSTVREDNLDVNNYDLVISENFDQEYGGNIIINKDGGFSLEMSRGGQGVVAEGSHDDAKYGNLLTVQKDPFLGSFVYSWNDRDSGGKEIKGVPPKDVVNRTIMHIPHSGRARDRKFLPGYYEFHLVKKPGSRTLEPVFVDCRDEESLLTLPDTLKQRSMLEK